MSQPEHAPSLDGNAIAHTPGPWEAKRHNRDSPGDGWLLLAKDGTLIGRIHDGVEERDPYTHIPVRLAQCDANARLAAAAPDLLAALTLILYRFDDNDLRLTVDAIQESRAAVRKALGHE